MEMNINFKETTMNNLIIASKQAVEAMKYELKIDWTDPDESLLAADKLREAIASLEKAIEQAEKQEPVAWLCAPDENGLFNFPTSDKGCKDCFPVFTRPQPKREPLTDVEIADLWDAQLFHIVDLKLAIDFVRDIEASHGIKGEA